MFYIGFLVDNFACVNRGDKLGRFVFLPNRTDAPTNQW
jgi:hypothetical protein